MQLKEQKEKRKEELEHKHPRSVINQLKKKERAES